MIPYNRLLQHWENSIAKQRRLHLLSMLTTNIKLQQLELLVYGAHVVKLSAQSH